MRHRESVRAEVSARNMRVNEGSSNIL